MNNRSENKNTKHKFGVMYKTWLGIKNDYRTLIDLEGVNVVDKSADSDGDEGDG